MYLFDSWHFLHAHKPKQPLAAGCHCGVPCMCTWGFLSAMSLSGCGDNVNNTTKSSAVHSYNSIGLDANYLPSSGTNCLEDDVPPLNCH